MPHLARPSLSKKPSSGPSHLPGQHSGVTDSDEVGWDAMAPPQLPGNAPVPAGGSGVGSGSLRVPACAPQPAPSHPPHAEGPTHRMLSIQECHVRWWASGRMRRSPRVTAALAAWAISPQRTYHCGLSRGSTTSLERLGMHVGGKPSGQHPEEPSPALPGLPALTCKVAPPWGCPGHPGTVPAPSGPPAPPSWPQTWAGPGRERALVTAMPRQPSLT